MQPTDKFEMELGKPAGTNPPPSDSEQALDPAATSSSPSDSEKAAGTNPPPSDSDRALDRTLSTPQVSAL